MQAVSVQMSSAYYIKIFNTRLWHVVFPKKKLKMHIQIKCRISTGWLQEKFMVRKPRVNEK
jgi:hypothetical protein